MLEGNCLSQLEFKGAIFNHLIDVLYTVYGFPCFMNGSVHIQT